MAPRKAILHIACVAGANLASHAGLFRGARISSLPKKFVGREEIRALLKTPAWVASANPIPYHLPLSTPATQAILHISLSTSLWSNSLRASFTHIEHRAGYGRVNKIKSRPKFLTILATNKFYILLLKIVTTIVLISKFWVLQLTQQRNDGSL